MTETGRCSFRLLIPILAAEAQAAAAAAAAALCGTSLSTRGLMRRN